MYENGPLGIPEPSIVTLSLFTGKRRLFTSSMEYPSLGMSMFEEINVKSNGVALSLSNSRQFANFNGEQAYQLLV